MTSTHPLPQRPAVSELVRSDVNSSEEKRNGEASAFTISPAEIREAASDQDERWLMGSDGFIPSLRMESSHSPPLTIWRELALGGKGSWSS